MAFDSVRGKYSYGFVRGTSMWPGLVPGDVLRAERTHAGELSPGDVIVLEPDGARPVVHRLMDVSRRSSGELELRTAGDRSGPDGSSAAAGVGEELLRVTGVLRKGAWRPLPGPPFRFCLLIPDKLVNLHCMVVRKFLWGAPGIDSEAPSQQ